MSASFCMLPAGVAAPVVLAFDDVVDEYDCWPTGADESWHGVVPGGDVVTAVAVEAGVGEAAGDAVDDGQRGGVGVVEGFAPAVEAGGAAGLGAGAHVVEVSHYLLAGHAEQQEAFDHVARAVLVVDVDDIMAALEFLCGGYLGRSCFCRSGFAVQVVDRATVEEALAVLSLEHGGRGRQFNAGSELGEVFELPAGGGVFTCLVTFH